METAWYIGNSALNADLPLEAFRQFFSESSERWLQHFQYRVVGARLLLQAILQRVLNGGDRNVREYSLGRQRGGLLILGPRPQGVQRYEIKCEILQDKEAGPLAEESPQMADSMNQRGMDAGHPVIFDRSEKPWRESVFRWIKEFGGTPVERRGM